MATEKNDDIAEFCLPVELLANSSLNEQNYQDNKIKSGQKLKELLLSVDPKTEKDTTVNKNGLSATSQSSTISTSPIFVTSYGNRNLSPHRSSDVNSNNYDFVDKCLFKSVKTSSSELRYESSHLFQKQGCSDIGLSSDFDLKAKGQQSRDPATANSTRRILPARRQSIVEKVLTEDDRLNTPSIYGDGDTYSFHDSTYDSTISCSRFGGEDEWVMDMQAEDSSPGPCPMSMSACSKPAHSVLFLKQKGTSDTLRQQVAQIVGESQMAVFSFEESDDVSIRAEMCSTVWLQVLSPLNKRVTEILSLLRSSNYNKNVTNVIVTDKILKEEIPIHADIYVEPLSRETVERLCSNAKENGSHNASNLKHHSSSVRNVTSTPESTISSASGRTSFGSPQRSHSPPRWCRVEHATKEKQRRERIKDSCDQLRVLLPYVKGRKTDMASILEMTVDYLKIVNSALSQDFHSQVIDIMSSGSPPLDDKILGMSMAYKKGIQKEQDGLNISPSGKSFHTVVSNSDCKASTKLCKDGNLNKRMITRSLSRALTSVGEDLASSHIHKNRKDQRDVYENNNGMIVTKRECSTTTGSSKPKKPHMTFPTPSSKQTHSSMTSLAVKDYKSESGLEELPSQNHLYPNFQFPHMFTEGDVSANRMFSSGHVSNNEGFAYVSHSQINLQSAHNIGERTEINNYGNVYFDGSFLPYSYSNLQDSANGNYYGTEYVNPNAVLPVTSYTPRVSAFASGRKFERVSTSNNEMLQNCAADVYNNNTTS